MVPFGAGGDWTGDTWDRWNWKSQRLDGAQTPNFVKAMRHGSHGTSSSATKTHQKKNATRKKKHLYLKYTNQVVLYISTIIYKYTIIYIIYIYINHYKSYFSPRWSPPVSALPASKSVYPAMVTSTDSSMPQGVFPNDLAPWGILQVWRNHDEPMVTNGNQWRFLDFWRNYDELHLDLFQWRFLEKLWWILQMNYI